MTDRWNLTAREQEVLNLLAVECLPSKEVAFRLGMAAKTLHAHMDHIRNKMGVRTSSQCTLLWQRELVRQEQLQLEVKHLATLQAYQHCPRCCGFGFVPKVAA
jgi:DNA-binding CsgD family transcriptional regulator